MTISSENDFLGQLQDLDRRIAELGHPIWIGAEPTFTDRFSEAPQWLNSAIGGDKQQRAEQLLARYLANFPGAALLRSVGRQYPGEEQARWNLGLYSRRDGRPAWSGPPDPLLLSGNIPDLNPAFLQAWSEAVTDGCRARQWPVRSQQGDNGTVRLLLRVDGNEPNPDSVEREHLFRPSVHAGPLPEEGMKDALADRGLYLLELGLREGGSGSAPCAELPLVGQTGVFLDLLALLAETANLVALPCLMLTGYPPPVDNRVAGSTLTPDPAVIEANLAPAADLPEFHRLVAPLFQAAEDCGLQAYRLHYNGREQDSGGGGQITIGGPSPLESPFFTVPRLLPGMVRYFNAHPGLSYWFATDYVGSGSQGPRPDEGLRERFLELEFALQQLESASTPPPDAIWAGLAPLLVDASGNSHRSELNVEKLWNPYLGPRGLLGLVELRPFRMAADAAGLSAQAALVRALVARLIKQPFQEPLRDWGDELHRRFALPFYLQQDLRTVLDDLQAHGFGLGPALSARLLEDSYRSIVTLPWRGVDVRLRRAQEFWPLLGDLTTQQPRDSRLVDASTTRVEIGVHGLPPGSQDDWELRIEGCRAPVNLEHDADGDLLLSAVRYRSFVPWMGLHPALPARDRVEFTLLHHPSGQALRLCLHEWQPDGSPYPGLPVDRGEANRRRRERVTLREVDAASLPPAGDASPAALGPYCLDLRRLSRSTDAS